MRRLLKLLVAAAGVFAAWRFWSARRESSEPITFDWDVPPPASQATPPPAPAPPPAPTPPAAGGEAETPADREQQSQTEAQTKFEQATDAERQERAAAAERLHEGPPAEPEDQSS